jgi:hypothetical protein
MNFLLPSWHAKDKLVLEKRFPGWALRVFHVSSRRERQGRSFTMMLFSFWGHQSQFFWFI